MNSEAVIIGLYGLSILSSVILLLIEFLSKKKTSILSYILFLIFLNVGISIFNIERILTFNFYVRFIPSSWATVYLYLTNFVSIFILISGRLLCLRTKKTVLKYCEDTSISDSERAFHKKLALSIKFVLFNAETLIYCYLLCLLGGTAVTFASHIKNGITLIALPITLLSILNSIPIILMTFSIRHALKKNHK